MYNAESFQVKSYLSIFSLCLLFLGIVSFNSHCFPNIQEGSSSVALCIFALICSNLMSFEFFSEEFPSKVNFTIVLWPLEHCFTSICWILGVLLQDRVARGLAEDELRTENLISKRLPCYQLHHKVILILLPSSSIILSLCSGQPVVSFTCAFPVLYIFNMDVPDSSSCHMMESKIIA